MMIGGLLLDQKDFSGAEANDRLALGLFEPIASSDAKSIDGKLLVAETRHNLGQLFAKGGRPADALREYETARPLYESVVARAPTNAWASGLLGALYLDMGEVAEALDGRLPRAC